MAAPCYIDELADMPMETQGKVVRALLVDQTFRAGGRQRKKVKRGCACGFIHQQQATCRPLIADGRFREDLYLPPRRWCRCMPAGTAPSAARIFRS